MHPLRLQKLLVLEPGIEPGTYCVLGSRHNQLDHSSTNFSILGGTRTPNLEIRSLTPYPVRPRGHPDAACTACRGSITPVLPGARSPSDRCSPGARSHRCLPPMGDRAPRRAKWFPDRDLNPGLNGESVVS